MILAKPSKPVIEKIIAVNDKIYLKWRITDNGLYEIKNMHIELSNDFHESNSIFFELSNDENKIF